MKLQPSNFEIEINIAKVLSESWELVAGIKSPVAWLIFFQSVFNAIFYILFAFFIIPKAMHLISQSPALAPNSLSDSASLLSLAKQSTDTISQQLIRSLLLDPVFMFLALIFAILTPFFIAAEYLLGIKQALGLKPTISKVFADCAHALPQLVLIFFIFMFPWALFYQLKPTPNGDELGLLNMVFHVLFFLGCILTSWACFAFAIPLVIIKRYPPIFAVIESLTVVISYWWTLIRLSLILLFITTASIFTLGIFLIWAIPMMLNMHGIVFREIFQLNNVGRFPLSRERQM